MKYTEAIEYMESLPACGRDAEPDSIKRLCGKLGNPQKELSFVHITGTNGKSSVLAYVSAVLKSAGYKVGSYSDPTIFEYRECFQVSGREITKKAFGELVERMKEICDSIVEEGFSHPAASEVEIAMAFRYFKEQGCQIVVWESRMDGLPDVDNMLENTKVAVFTPISMDCVALHGKSFEENIAQKAGIIKSGCQVVTAVQTQPVMQVIRAQAEVVGAAVTIADAERAKKIRYGLEKQRFDYGEYKNLEISLAGVCQIQNTVLAIEVMQCLRSQGYHVSEEALRKGLKEAECKGRFTVVGKKPYFIADCARNEDAAEQLAQSIEVCLANKRIIFIMGMLREREYERIIELTHKYAEFIITVAVPGDEKTMSSYELAAEVAKVHQNVTAVDSLEEAVEISYLLTGKEDVIIAFGSMAFTGRLMQIVENAQGRKTL